ncbi:uncharacterized protein BJ171DRAFT_471063 [Polychytrium aggregatum]|uniref:uncharacterized protein n=1 Tax=Polychytrium aggregatum TaxID=110093 RepID=UPI0022FE7B9D|nr:uncharacterized protein BJ171DRAFT_471063 [Polychytrium aggregatum]KAI9209420.1 hypothetical protein BJ171DRAFT_471063 [Polychytrium aggregatum]
MVHRRPVIISPIYLNSPATQYWVGCYNDSFWDVYSEDNFADPSYFVSIDRRAKAFSAFKQSAESGFVSSQFNLGLYYENGIGTEVNLEQALYWYSKASDHGHPESQRRLFVLSSTNAVSNSAEAQFLLGRCFEEGFGTSVDIKAALHRYRNASSHGHAQAKIAIFKLVARAAQDGATTRVPYLGWCYEHGAGVQKDGQEAFWVYKCGAEEEDVESLFQLARCYEKGIGTTIHRERAIGFYQKAASHKHEQATQALKRLDPTGSRRTMRKLGTMLNLLPSK